MVEQPRHFFLILPKLVRNQPFVRHPLALNVCRIPRQAGASLNRFFGATSRVILWISEEVVGG